MTADTVAVQIDRFRVMYSCALACCLNHVSWMLLHFV